MTKQFVRLIVLSLLLPQALFASSITIMTFNIENGGTQVSFDQVVESIKKSKADVVGIQEAWGNTRRLAHAVGWHYYNPAQHIISRFPLYETAKQNPYFTLIEMQPGRFVAMANVHLLNEAYGPELVTAGKTVEEVMATEQSIRLPGLLPFIKQLTALARQDTPVFLVGDFNSGSHKDWTPKTVGKLVNHRYALNWPSTRALQAYGFVDSYQQLHPNTLKHPGYTWPAQRPVVKHSVDHFNPTHTDMPERIDFIFSAGPTNVLESKLVGEAHNKEVDLAISPWPSDHRAVVSTFNVNPVALKRQQLVPTVRQVHKVSTISVTKHLYKSKEAIDIQWTHAPGNRFDYLSIEPSTKEKTVEKICLYTKAKVNGSLRYAGHKPRDCFGKAVPWPLKPGVYHVKLMLDDSYRVLAATTIRIID